MGRTRQESEQQESPQERQAREALVLILAGESGLEGVAILSAAVGAIALLLPAAISGALRDAVSTDIARMVLRDYPRDTSGSGALSVASQENIAYRALYGISAAKRVVAALTGPSESEISERLDKWASAEASYYEGHQNASDRREKAAQTIDAMAEIHGPLLGWHDTGHAHTHRPEHLKASGKSFDVRKGPPAETGGVWPGEAPNCDCVVVPPKKGAEVLR